MKNILKSVLLLSFCLFGFISCHKKDIRTSDSVQLFAALGDAPASNQFEVRVNGRDAFVEKMEKLDIPVHYVQLTSGGSEKINIEVIAGQPIRSYTISPVSKGIKGVVDGNKLTFSLAEAAYLILKVNDMEDLFFLIDRKQDYMAQIKDLPLINIKDFDIDNTGKIIETKKIQDAIDHAAASKGVLFFPKGIYRTGQLNLRSDMAIVLDSGALIYGSTNPQDYADKALIRMDSVSNFKLLGNGTIDGAGWSGLRRNGAREYHLLFASNCNNVEIDGVVLRDPTFWNTRVFRSSNFHMKNIKVLNNRPYKNWTNTDGVDFDSSNNCSLVNSVIHAGDDNLVVKGLDSERKFDTRHILFDKILTLSNSAASKIGTETCVERFEDITFRNIDIVKCKRAMVINAFDSTDIRNVNFENIHIENFDFNGSEGPRMVDFEITNKSWRECTGLCTIDTVTVKNIVVYCDLKHVDSQILGHTDVFSVNNVLFQNIVIAGGQAKKLTDANIKVNEFVKSGFEN